MQFQHTGVAKMLGATPCLPDAQGDRLETVTSEKQGNERYSRPDGLDNGIARGERCRRCDHQRDPGFSRHRNSGQACQFDAFVIPGLLTS
ncbi:hypothetical protein PPGU19_100100 (plasmid) [Paraburkholderia sp. PGU19]|nr:hypothetical protein PPGU19_100100 [Paraburkholderia sp. PGU19]